MPSNPLEMIRQRVADLGDSVQFLDRNYDACGFHREVTCPPEAIEEIAKVFQEAMYYLEMMAATDCEGSATLSYTFNRLGPPDRTLVRLTIEPDQTVPSISAIFPGANWNEREAFELVGVQFSGHPNLKRLLLPEDATFFPLRKDYGIPEDIRAARMKHKKKMAKLAAKKPAKPAKAAKKPEEIETTKDDGGGPKGNGEGESGATGEAKPSEKKEPEDE